MQKGLNSLLEKCSVPVEARFSENGKSGFISEEE